MAAYDRKLVLENGEEYYGFGFGAPVSGKVSELVFQTSMIFNLRSDSKTEARHSSYP